MRAGRTPDRRSSLQIHASDVSVVTARATTLCPCVVRSASCVPRLAFCRSARVRSSVPPRLVRRPSGTNIRPKPVAARQHHVIISIADTPPKVTTAQTRISGGTERCTRLQRASDVFLVALQRPRTRLNIRTRWPATVRRLWPQTGSRSHDRHASRRIQRPSSETGHFRAAPFKSALRNHPGRVSSGLQTLRGEHNGS